MCGSAAPVIGEVLCVSSHLVRARARARVRVRARARVRIRVSARLPRGRGDVGEI